MAVATSTPSYSSPTSLARASARLRLARAGRRARGRRAAATSAPRTRTAPRSSRPPSPSSASLGGEPARRCCTMSSSSSLAEHRHEDAAVLELPAPPCSASAGIVKRLVSGLSCAAPVDHVEREPDHHPGAARPPRALVQHHHADPAGGRQQRAQRRGQRHRPAAHRHATAASGTRAARSGSRKRSTITDRWAIVNASIAPNAKMPARNSRSRGQRQRERRAPRRRDRHVGRGPRRVQAPDQRWGSGGWWPASSRAAPRPSIWPLAACDQHQRAHRADRVAQAVGQPARARSAATTPSTGASTNARPAPWSRPSTGSAISATTEMPTNSTSTASRAGHDSRFSPRRPDAHLAGQPRGRLDAGGRHARR